MPISPTLLRFHTEPSAGDLAACEAVRSGRINEGYWSEVFKCVLESVGFA